MNALKYLTIIVGIVTLSILACAGMWYGYQAVWMAGYNEHAYEVGTEMKALQNVADVLAKAAANDTSSTSPTTLKSIVTIKDGKKMMVGGDRGQTLYLVHDVGTGAVTGASFTDPAKK